MRGPGRGCIYLVWLTTSVLPPSHDVARKPLQSRKRIVACCSGGVGMSLTTCKHPNCTRSAARALIDDMRELVALLMFHDRFNTLVERCLVRVGCLRAAKEMDTEGQH